MNRETSKKLWKVIKAFADEEDIQARTPNGKWITMTPTTDLDFDNHLEWRVMPADTLITKITTPLSISQLVTHVGDENIQVQGLNSCFVSGKVKKKDAEITFATEREKGMALCGVGQETHRCIILWLPIDKLPAQENGGAE